MSRPLPPPSPDDPTPDPAAVAALAEYAAPPQFCNRCGHVGLVPKWRSKWVTTPFTAQALAGVQVKTGARLVAWPWLTCPGCGHASEGK